MGEGWLMILVITLLLIIAAIAAAAWGLGIDRNGTGNLEDSGEFWP